MKDYIDELENVLNCHVDVVTTGIEDKQFIASNQYSEFVFTGQNEMFGKRKSVFKIPA